MRQITVLAIIAIVSVLGILGTTIGTGILSQQAHAAACNVFSFDKVTGSCAHDDNGHGSFNLHFHDFIP